jgi:PAS domain S-box-containing protein
MNLPDIDASPDAVWLQSRMLASIVESSYDAIVSKSLAGIITSWNVAAERIFGFTADEAIGQPITIIIPADRHSEERDILGRIRRGERTDHFETIRRRKDGSLIAVSLTVSPVTDANGLVIGASKIARDITEQQRMRDQVAILAREAEHRSRNLLSSVQAIVNLSQADTVDEFKREVSGRIQALSNVLSLFTGSRWTGAELSSIAEQELAPFSDKVEGQVTMGGTPVLLEPDAAQAAALILHELATNAAKYGALSVPAGHVDVKWSPGSSGQLQLIWTETNGPPVQKPTRRGFGRRIIDALIRQQKGEVRFDWRPEGLTCEISFQA